MKYRKFKQNKLWRDKLVDLMNQNQSKIHYKELDDQEFIEQLKIKLLEEAQEVCCTNTKEDLIEELADILEIISAFCTVQNIAFQEIINIKNKKHNNRGGFEGRKFVTIAEHPIGSFGEKYCLNDPEKYPEILD
ncbi:nucleoside triphosphate pyrophosphohydrolase [Candidatus Babela massiliensis]|uniref:Uncharacterized conserved protein n=1 Tax=Candidatus Babela massiliensis TaxID=673862 RepID=V6DI92_9BACT|nr:nucleoside triphosphate pyrophosphohydrolase [Candidatus Babela massiliensis]CDK30648.1 Uncharacterized conserved protein [Candidatus Babela massiliensis]